MWKKNKLSFIKQTEFRITPSGGRRSFGLFKCDCGTTKEICISMVRRGVTKSCGCLNIQQITKLGKLKGDRKGTFKHGFFGTRFYAIFHLISQRCTNPKNISYKWYGQKKIKNNFKNFEHFKNTMYQEYIKHCKKYGEKNTTLDRIDGEKDYSPNNCRWATYKVQENNRNNNTIIEFNGKKQTLSQWTDEFGLTRYFTCKKLGYIREKKHKKSLHRKGNA